MEVPVDLTIQNEKKFKLSKKGKKRRHLRNLMSQHSTRWVTLRAGKQLGLQTHQQTPKFPGIWAKPRSSCRHTQTCTPRQRTPSQRWEKKKRQKKPTTKNRTLSADCFPASILPRGILLDLSDYFLRCCCCCQSQARRVVSGLSPVP